MNDHKFKLKRRRIQDEKGNAFILMWECVYLNVCTIALSNKLHSICLDIRFEIEINAILSVFNRILLDSMHNVQHSNYGTYCSQHPCLMQTM